MSVIDELKNAEYRVTPWEWLRIQLNIYSCSINSSAEDHLISFIYDSRVDGKIVCVIANSYVGKLVSEGASRETQLEIYRGWVDGEKDQLSKVLSEPLIQQIGNCIDDVFIFSIMDNQPHDPIIACYIDGQHVEWLEDGAKGSNP